MTTDDPLAASATELLHHLIARHGPDVAWASPPETVQSGMDSSVAFISLRGPLPPEWRRPLVLRVHGSMDRADTSRRECAVQRWCAARGYPTPAILLEADATNGFSRPVQVMERAPGRPLLEVITSGPWRIRAALGLLANRQVALHTLDPDGFPDPEVRAAGRQIDLVEGWVDELHDTDLARAVAEQAPIALRLDAGPVAVCHGDFHPLNVVADGDRTTVLDWTNAGLGDPMGDLARSIMLMRVAKVAAETPMERRAIGAVAPALAAGYRRAYATRGQVDADRLRAWTRVHTLHGWAQVCALHAGLIGTDTERARVPPELTQWLRDRYERG
jgi:aminoglycoside phosphotransferase (APT) family kinase protein